MLSFSTSFVVVMSAGAALLGTSSVLAQRFPPPVRPIQQLPMPPSTGRRKPRMSW